MDAREVRLTKCSIATKSSTTNLCQVPFVVKKKGFEGASSNEKCYMYGYFKLLILYLKQNVRHP